MRFDSCQRERSRTAYSFSFGRRFAAGSQLMRHTILAFFACALLSAQVVAQNPHQGVPSKIDGLQAAAEVDRDIYGIAHVRAGNDHDLYFMQGYVHAQDRLFQMDVSRRTASGTLAELLGPAALASDVELRTIGIRRAAERSMGVISMIAPSWAGGISCP